MVETPPAQPPQPPSEPSGGPGPGVTLVVNAQYVKDLSFENPRAPNTFLQLKEQPHIEVNVNVDARTLQEHTYEVVLTVRANAQAGGEPAFITELVYGGVFTIMNLPENALRPILLIECPRVLFPFARRILADVTRDGGFPPLLLSPIDFVALYRRQFALQEQPPAGQA